MSSSQEVHLVATITLKDGKLQQAIDILKNLTETVHKSEPGAMRYFFFQTKNEQGQDQIVAVEKYTNAEAHKGHMTSAHFQAFQKQVPELLAGPLDIKFGSYLAGFESRSNL